MQSDFILTSQNEMLEVGGLFLNISERLKIFFFFFQFLTKGTPCPQNESHKNQ